MRISGPSRPLRPSHPPGSDLGKFGAHRRDGRLVVRRAEDGRARNERIRTGFRDGADVLDFHSSIHFEPDIATARFNAPANRSDLFKRGGNEFLPAKPWIDRHDEYEIQLVNK